MRGPGVSLMTETTVVDMQRGVYRKIYSGFIWGERICSVSMEAEAWFWRIHGVADDFGNLPGESKRLAIEAGGGRTIDPAKAAKWTAELVRARLVVWYNEDRNLHIVGFESMQPAGRNGRKIKKVPMHPPECEDGNPGESKAIQGDPGASEGIRGNYVPPMPMPMPTTKEGAAAPPFPPVLDREDFRKAWDDYLAYRREAKLKRLQPRSISAQFAEMVAWGPDLAIQAIRTTIAKGWTGIFEPKGEFGRPAKPPPKPGPEKLSDAGQSEFKAWWGRQSRDEQEAFAKSKGVAFATVDQAVNWRKVPATWATTGATP